jgi:hypothetical protein
MAKGSDKLKAKHFVNGKFLLYFFIAFALHFIWNLGFLIYPVPLFFDVKYIILIAAAWFFLLRIVKQGVTECMRIPQTVPMPQPEPQLAGVGAGPAAPVALPQPLSLRGLAGMYSGSVFPSPRGSLVIGRDARIANIVYPPDTRGISSVHCEVRHENGIFVLIDKNSSNGTFLADGTRLMPERPYPIARRSGFYLATRENMFEIE